MGLFNTVTQRWRNPSQSIEGISNGMEIPNNPSGKDFLDSAKASIRKTIEKYSVTQNAVNIGANNNNSQGVAASPFGASGVLNPLSDIDLSFETSTLGLAVPVDTNKTMRIQSYDNIARFPELDWCINEIANDFLHEDFEGNFINLKIKADKSKFIDGADKVLEEEFRHIVSNFDLRANGYNMMRKFIIEGELCFENVIDPNHPEYGIIGEKYIPNMFYDFLRDRQTGQVCGLYVDPEKIKRYVQFGVYGNNASSYGGQSTSIFNAIRQVPAYSYTYSQDMSNKIVFPWEQVTYTNSGVLSEDASIVFPHIEQVVVPVRQLILLHDAMIILRITRAPEKLVFNLDMAGLQPREARNYVRKFIEQRKSKKAVVGSGSLTNVYNAETMLDAYYFWKTSEGGGTRVENISTSSTHYNELRDVEYFLRRILKLMNIPWQRWSESAVNRQDENSITNEEFSFSKMIVRHQQNFSSAIKKTFITHLRLKGLFDKFDLNESDFDVVMNPPALFVNYHEEKRFNDFLTVMGSAQNLDFLSKNLILQKIFGWTESEVKENEVNVRREALYKAQTDFMIDQSKAQGTPTGGRVWLDPEKYINPPTTTPPTGTDVNGGAPMPPPDNGGMPPPPADNGGGMPPPAVEPPMDNGNGEPMPPPQGAEIPPQEAPVNTLEIPEPEVPQDDSGTTKAEKELPVNPEFGDYEDRSAAHNTDLGKFYPETEKGIEDMESGKGTTMKDIFDKTLGDEFAKYKPLQEIFDEELGGTDGKKSKKNKRKEYIKTLKSIFDKEIGDKEEDNEPASDKLTDVFKDVFIRKVI